MRGQPFRMGGRASERSGDAKPQLRRAARGKRPASCLYLGPQLALRCGKREAGEGKHFTSFASSPRSSSKTLRAQRRLCAELEPLWLLANIDFACQLFLSRPR